MHLPANKLDSIFFSVVWLIPSCSVSQLDFNNDHCNFFQDIVHIPCSKQSKFVWHQAGRNGGGASVLLPLFYETLVDHAKPYWKSSKQISLSICTRNASGSIWLLSKSICATQAWTSFEFALFFVTWLSVSQMSQWFLQLDNSCIVRWWRCLSLKRGSDVGK